MQRRNLHSFAQSTSSICGFCGFAAFRAESLWLSVKLDTLFGGYAARGGASALSKRPNGKPEAFRTGGGKAA